LFVTVQVLVSPTAIAPAQSAELEPAYPDGPVSATLYAPALMETVWPGDSNPANETGPGLLPVTLIVKPPARAVSPLSLMTCSIKVRFGWTSSLTVVDAAA